MNIRSQTLKSHHCQLISLQVAQMKRNVALKQSILKNRKPGDSAGRRAMLDNIAQTEDAIAMLEVRILVEYETSDVANVFLDAGSFAVWSIVIIVMLFVEQYFVNIVVKLLFISFVDHKILQSAFPDEHERGSKDRDSESQWQSHAEGSPH
jgi:hypothetical protein